MSALAFAVALVSLAAAASAQTLADRVLVLDRDAHFVTDDSAGALFVVDPSAPIAAAPAVVAAADAGAPFVQAVDVAISPADGRAYVADHGESPLALTEETGFIVAVAPDGTLTTISSDPLLVDPSGLTFLPDGRLVVVDPEADPSNLGRDRANNLGHGAVFAVDVATGQVTLISDGTLHGSMPAIGDGESAFDDPTWVAHDPIRDVLYVADVNADPLGFSYFGALYRVSLADGRVDLVSSSSDFLFLTGLATYASTGDVLATDKDDAAPGNTVVFQFDLGNPDPEFNVSVRSGGQYSLLEDVGLDWFGNPFLGDSGEWDPMAMDFLEPPRIFRIDPLESNPALNAIVVSESVELVLPIAVAALSPISVDRVDPAQIPSVPPGGCDGAVTVTVLGANLSPALALDFGPDVVVNSVEFEPGVRLGSTLRVSLSPVGAPTGTVDLTATHPWGMTDTLSSALEMVDTGMGPGMPGAPCSDEGDATCDGAIDGVDLAVLGMHFGARYCSGTNFLNDADFDDDNDIDGEDLAILATFFGTR